jgi:hypothetical protein
MKLIPLENLHADSGESRILEFIATIPDGHAMTIVKAMRETGITGRELWKKVAGDCIIHRYVGKVKTSCLVNAKTAKSIAS